MTKNKLNSCLAGVIFIAFLAGVCFAQEYRQCPSRVSQEDYVSLKEFLLAKILEQEKALILARETLEKRLEGMNEFRVQLKDQASRFITREELEAKIDKAVVEKNIRLDRAEADIKELREGKAKLEGKADQSSVNMSTGIAIVGIIIALGSLITNCKKTRQP